ncbi:MAG: hypothetical protein FD123_2609 [Bacteroidetes bacterium]|nr:MAG: hypothetical protein FD123_2609 [Bacteroidota bacterium]
MPNTATRIRPALLLFFAAVSLTTCKLIDPAEDVPAYIHIDHIDLVNVNTATQGTSQQQITEAWVYVDNELIGAFELPATLPVLFEGEHIIRVAAGVKQNGLSSTRAIYPFMKFYNETVNLQRGNTVTLQPQVEYFPGTSFPWLEGFEDPGLSLIDIPSAPFQNILEKDSYAFEGSFSGFVRLTSDTFDCEVKSAGNFVLPTDGTPVWLELHYQCNNPFVVGVVTNTNEFRPWIEVDTSAAWNKIYIDLTTVCSRQPIASTIQVYIAMQKTADIAEARIYLDNIKLLHQ